MGDAERWRTVLLYRAIYLRFQDTHGLEELVGTGLDELGRSRIQYLHVSFAAGSRAWSTGDSHFWPSSPRARGPRGPNWDIIKASSARGGVSIAAGVLAIPAELRTPVSHEIPLAVAVFASVDIVSEIEARQLRWCDTNVFDESIAERYDRVHGIGHIREFKKGRDAGHATQQIFLLKAQDPVSWSDR